MELGPSVGRWALAGNSSQIQIEPICDDRSHTISGVVIFFLPSASCPSNVEKLGKTVIALVRHTCLHLPTSLPPRRSANFQVRRRDKILVHCRHGTSTSVAVITLYRLLKHGVAVRNTLSVLESARGDSMDLSPAMAAGLQQLQEDFAREKEKRLVERVSMAPILSLGF